MPDVAAADAFIPTIVSAIRTIAFTPHAFKRAF
jgi:hypothetical protein